MPRLKVSELNKIGEQVEVIRAKLQSVDDGELSVSPYDTAWVALVKDINGNDAPQFPSSLEWIVNNQFPDGSWGHSFFSAYDRLRCTLACVVALKTWNCDQEKWEKGMSFLGQYLHKLNDEDLEHQPSGFEVAFPTLIEMAQKLGLEVLQDPTVLQDLYAKRELKLKRIPMEVLHNVPTTLLYSLEGIPDLDWEKLVKLQHKNGSFLCSPSSTAYALMQTKDKKCLKYLTEVVERFKGGAPHCYPMDLFERLWIVDRLERLGISRYFKSEIKEFLEYVYRFWTPNGISWSRDTIEFDIDDTSMGFRMLRLHGYDVNANAFQHFERDGQFFCFVGQTSQGITEMLSLYRVSQVLFPKEQILQEAKEFASKLLREKQSLGQVLDRWIITKDLVGEVEYNLCVPWYANLSLIETRYYLDQYGADDDVWIGKVLYRMYNVSNNHYLELAKLDYNHCQKMHQMEWVDIQDWYEEFNLRDFGISNDELLKAYFQAVSSIFEPERATERLAWARSTVLVKAVSFYFKAISIEQQRTFIEAFHYSSVHSNDRKLDTNGIRNELVEVILKTLSDIGFKIQEVHGTKVDHILKNFWNAWLWNSQTQEDKYLVPNNEAELLVCTLQLCADLYSLDLTSQPEYVYFTSLTNKICNRLCQNQNFKAGWKENNNEEMTIDKPVDSVQLDMQQLLQHVLRRDGGIHPEIKQTFLTVAKSYYYTAHCEPTTINRHISKALFDAVL
ncbi:hypothetical protein IFM89_019808 [Coptis chinensis]|uniref:Uncharacterized protein n=1 Tax=Coptis chinensis TaxID=261450 RepID=A0A835M0R8_9MAGN|nr:hypothetical protein IFM89_019808 [Coptis chinensis]